MKQNIYDSREFFERYMSYRKNPLCLNETLEHPALLSILPPLTGKRVLDIGCGAGGFCLEAVDRGATSVIGIDISKLMCAEAIRSLASHKQRCKILNIAVEDASFESNSFDVIVSSLTLHYVASYSEVISKVGSWLTQFGVFIYSVNHPIYTAGLNRIPDFGTGALSTLNLDRYQEEGIRNHYWFVDGVIKYHRTIQTQINALSEAGFKINYFLEPKVLPEYRDAIEELRNADRRPVFMIISGIKE